MTKNKAQMTIESPITNSQNDKTGSVLSFDIMILDFNCHLDFVI